MSDDFLIKLKLSYGDSEESTDSLIDKLEKLDKLQKEFGSKGNGFSTLESDLKNTDAEFEKLNSTINRQVSSLDKVDSANIKAAKSVKEFSDKASKAAKEVDSIGDSIEDTSKKTDGATKSINRYGDKFKAVFEKVFPIYGKMNDALSSVIDNNNSLSDSASLQEKSFASIKKTLASATKSALAFVATPIGATIAVLGTIASITAKWAKYNDEVLKTNRLIESITSESEQVVNAVRLRAIALQNVFDVSVSETTKTAQKLVQQFNISYEKAFDEIEEGLVRGAKANDQFFDSLSEYGTFFADAGYSVTEFRRVVETGFDLGIYQDKLPDAIKEFNLSINEQTDATRKALVGAFGEKFTNKLFKNINSGAISTKDALSLVSKEYEKVGLNATNAGALTADVFRGAGEDVGGAVKVFDAINKSLNVQVKEYTELEKAAKRTVEIQKELAEEKDRAFKSDSFLKFQTTVTNGWLKVQVFLLQSLTRIRESIQDSFAVFGIVGDSFDKVLLPINKLISKFKEFEIVQKLMNGVATESDGVLSKVKDVIIDMINPFFFITNAIKGFGAALNGVLNVASEFGRIMTEAIAPFKEFDFSSPIKSLRNFDFSSVKNTGKRIGTAFTDGFNEVMNVKIDSDVKLIDENKIKQNKKLITSAIPPIKKYSDSIDGLKDKIKDLAEQMNKQVFKGDFIGAEKSRSEIVRLKKLIEDFETTRKMFIDSFGDGLDTGQLEKISLDGKVLTDQNSVDEFKKVIEGLKVEIDSVPDVEVGLDFNEKLFNDAKNKIADLFKVDRLVVDQLFEGLQEVYGLALEIGRELYNQKLQSLDQEIEALASKKEIIKDGLEDEYNAQQQGLSNSYEARVQSLKEIEAQEKKAIKRREELKTKAAKAEFIAETASQTLNLISASAKIYNSLAAIPVIGVVGATAVITGMFAAFAAFKAKAFSEIGRLNEGGSMEKYFSEQDVRNGNVRTHGKIAPKTGGKSDKNKQFGMRVGDSNLYVNGNETVMRNELSKHGLFFEELNRNWQDYDNIDLNGILKHSLNPKEYNVSFNEYREFSLKNESSSITEKEMRAIMDEHAEKVSKKEKEDESITTFL